MIPNKPTACPPRGTGFTLPAVLVVVAALLIMVIGLLAMSGIERKTARSYVDLQRADMAATAGLETVKAILDKETANDDFLIVEDVPPVPTDGNVGLEAVPYLYLARGETDGDNVKYRHVPLFSTNNLPNATSATLAAPDAVGLVGADPEKIQNLPWNNPAFTAWVPIKAKKNGKDQTVARYAYWVEDLQGKINPKIAGKKTDPSVRNEYPFPAPGINPKPLSKEEPALNGIAVDALDPQATDALKQTAISSKIVTGRDIMVSPNSILAATGYAPPIQRGSDGLLTDPIASALEKNLSPSIHAYEERPTIPYSLGISKQSVGQPKLNLNKLLSDPRTQAVNDFASHIEKALPLFGDKSKGRPGGFPENYLKTLAAGALDYADSDRAPTIVEGQYRGIDGYPYLSEIILRIEYTKREAKNGRLLLSFQFRLFAEFWNLTNKPVNGRARLSYEVAMNPEGINSNPAGEAFDELMTDPSTTHNFELIDGKYFSGAQDVTLDPDQYKMYDFGYANYTIDVGPNNIDYKTTFYMVEKEKDARGITLRWNDQNVERIPAIVRDRTGSSFVILNVKPNVKSVLGKAAIPGHSYGPYNNFIDNMGDPRIAPYITGTRLGENAYPKNMSPNRRNIRRDIYGNTSLYYARVLPSEWPDGGHDSKYGIFPQIADTDLRLPTDTGFKYTLPLVEANAPQRISDAGRFYSATELGNVYDPIMWSPAYEDLKGKAGSGTADTKLVIDGTMPSTRHVFPDITKASAPSTVYGGGNTLRIGRYEHKRFDEPGLRAAYLLDLFHAGKSTSDLAAEREGNVVTIDGQININTASKDTIRAMAAGMLKQDTELRKITSWSHDLNSGAMAPASTKMELGTPTTQKVADIVAEAIVLNRPYSGMGELSAAKTANKDSLFGNRDLYSLGTNINWSDSAAEELFARIHDASTFRSRNFRVWVIGQSLTGSESNPEIIAEARKVYTVFADPGERDGQGQINIQNNKSRVTYENGF